jgi:hypothetical protein
VALQAYAHQDQRTEVERLQAQLILYSAA